MSHIVGLIGEMNDGFYQAAMPREGTALMSPQIHTENTLLPIGKREGGRERETNDQTRLFN